MKKYILTACSVAIIAIMAVSCVRTEKYYDRQLDSMLADNNAVAIANYNTGDEINILIDTTRLRVAFDSLANGEFTLDSIYFSDSMPTKPLYRAMMGVYYQISNGGWGYRNVYIFKRVNRKHGTTTYYCLPYFESEDYITTEETYYDSTTNETVNTAIYASSDYFEEEVYDENDNEITVTSPSNNVIYQAILLSTQK